MKTQADRVLLVPAAPGHDTEAAFTVVPHYTRYWYSPDPGLVREVKRSRSLTTETPQDTRDVSTVAPAHTSWAEWGPGWQLLDFREGKRARESEMLKLEKMP